MIGRLPNVLAIGGSDPSAGAGIQADVRTITAMGAYACTAITVLTAQNSAEVRAVWPVPGRRVRKQLDTLLSDVTVQAIKIGALGGQGAARAVADAVESRPDLPVVLDPVHRASAGAWLLDRGARRILLERLIPRATLLTPNVAESAYLGGSAPPVDVEGLRDAAVRLLALGAQAVLVKGGHLPPGATGDITDIYADSFRVEALSAAPIPGGPFHGTGCVLASAAAVALARGETQYQAALIARQVVRTAMHASTRLQVGGGRHALWLTMNPESGHSLGLVRS
jgi:hydroxymethylpyrimidine/phosphomethylpyrimidine kinase